MKSNDYEQSSGASLEGSSICERLVSTLLKPVVRVIHTTMSGRHSTKSTAVWISPYRNRCLQAQKKNTIALICEFQYTDFVGDRAKVHTPSSPLHVPVK
jgi:hypothetical protein